MQFWIEGNNYFCNDGSQSILKSFSSPIPHLPLEFEDIQSKEIYHTDGQGQIATEAMDGPHPKAIHLNIDMDVGIRDKRAFISGGTHGIGLAIAKMLQTHGAKVIVGGRDPERFKRAWNYLQPVFLQHHVEFIQFDASDMFDIDKVVRRLNDDGGVDILINNVGGGGTWEMDASTDITKMAVFDEVYQKNTRAMIQFTVGLLPKMIQREYGRIITISSTHGRESHGGQPWFETAKAAQIAFMKSMAKKTLADYQHGVTFNTLAPGHIRINGKNEDLDGPWSGEVQHVAHAVRMFLPEIAEHINGACLVVDGGESNAY